MSRPGLNTHFRRTGPLHPAAQALASGWYRTQAAGTVVPAEDLVAYARSRGLVEARLDDYGRCRVGQTVLRSLEQVDALVASRRGA